MNKNIKTAALILLTMVMVVVWFSAFKTINQRSMKRPVINAAGRPSEIRSPGLEIKNRLTSSYKDWGRNPFELAKGMSTKGDLVLGGILWDDVLPKAIINEKIVGVGETVEGFVLKEIKKDSIVVDDGSKQILLKVWHEGKEQDF